MDVERLSELLSRVTGDDFSEAVRRIRTAISAPDLRLHEAPRPLSGASLADTYGARAGHARLRGLVSPGLDACASMLARGSNLRWNVVGVVGGSVVAVVFSAGDGSVVGCMAQTRTADQPELAGEGTEAEWAGP